MTGPDLPAAGLRPPHEADAQLALCLDRLGRIEAAYRKLAGHLLASLPPEGDIAASIRRALEGLDH